MQYCNKLISRAAYSHKNLLRITAVKSAFLRSNVSFYKAINSTMASLMAPIKTIY